MPRDIEPCSARWCPGHSIERIGFSRSSGTAIGRSPKLPSPQYVFTLASGSPEWLFPGACGNAGEAEIDRGSRVDSGQPLASCNRGRAGLSRSFFGGRKQVLEAIHASLRYCIVAARGLAQVARLSVAKVRLCLTSQWA